jgi:hypothetical protein
MPPAETSPFRLLVEGPDDFHSVIQLMARHGYDWDDRSAHRPFVKSEDGIEKLLEALPVVLKGSYDRIGVVVDADLAPTDRWAQLRSRAAGLTLPALPQLEGTMVEGIKPGSRVGFWLMPDNSSPGRLEDFLGKLVSAEDASWDFADEALSEARRRGAPCTEHDHAKGRVHTWLAWQREPGQPFGIALRSKVFRHDTDDALRFVTWFRRLFVDP